METVVEEPVATNSEAKLDQTAVDPPKRGPGNPNAVLGGPSPNPDGRAGKRVPIKELEAAQDEIARLKEEVERLEEKRAKEEVRVLRGRVLELERELAEEREGRAAEVAVWEARLAALERPVDAGVVDEGTRAALELLERMSLGEAE